MRRWALITLALCCSIPAFATKSVNIHQLEQELSAVRNKPDADAAFTIGDLQPTERISSEQLQQMQKLTAGQKSREALDAIAGASQFLPPPADEVPNTPLPDLVEQRRIMTAVVSYVIKALPHLPDFLATENTRRFEDQPLVQMPYRLDPYRPIHFVDETSASVAYRDGHEVVDPAQVRLGKTQSAVQGLTVKGVFGPILNTVLLDAAHSELKWSRWERGRTGLEAVFKFSVPKDHSHYEVDYCCVAEEGAIVANVFQFHRVVAYHGEIAADPSSGIVHRLMLIAELKPDDPISEAAILVEYGPVEIGGVTYTCPLRSIAKSLAQAVMVDPRSHFALARQLQPLKHALSETIFSSYHVFRTESRILLQAQATPGTDQAPSNQAPTASGIPDLAGIPTPSEHSEPNVSSASIISQEPVTSVAPPAAETPLPEITQTEATSLPEFSSGSPDDTGVTLRTTTRLVDMTVLAFDKKGRPVTDLKQDELEIFDNGRRQTLRSFEQAATAAPGKQETTPASAPAPDEVVVTNRPKAEAVPFNTVVMMIDAANVAFNDLSYAREEMLRFLKNAPEGERIGLYILRSYGFQVLLEPTTDHARFSAALAAWTPHAQDMARAQDEEQRNRQHFDWVAHGSDLAFVNGNDESNPDPSSYTSGSGVAQAMTNGVDPKLRNMGRNSEGDALSSLVTVSRHLAGLPGHKTLVWVSSDNALADWSSRAAGREQKGNRYLDPLSMRAREALNEARVSIYPLDVSQLEAGVISADLQNRIIEKRIESPDEMGPPPPPNPTGRLATMMHEDTRGIEPGIRELAEATGGRALRRASDIANELHGIVADGRAAYLVSFTPDTPADDKYHVLTAKTTRPGVTLRFRTGYLYEKEPATIKDRFRQAVLDPKDENEIGLNATKRGKGDDASIQLTITGTDLALTQQGGRWMDKLDIFLVKLDEQTGKAKVEGQTLGLRLTPETYARMMREGIPVKQTIGKSSGTTLRVIVIDENSRRIGTVTIPAA